MNKQLKNLPNEKWVWVVGFVGMYEVSCLGRVRSYKRWKHGPRGLCIKPQRILHAIGRYHVVCFCKNGIAYPLPVSHLVLAAFIEPKPFEGAEAHHRDGDTWNNKSSNLEWVPHSHASIRKVLNAQERKIKKLKIENAKLRGEVLR